MLETLASFIDGGWLSFPVFEKVEEIMKGKTAVRAVAFMESARLMFMSNN